MNKTCFILVLFFAFTACKEKQQARETIKITIEKFKIDSSSIRAIEILNDSAVIFAGSKGDIGIITGSAIKMIASKIVTDTIIPHFRALSYTKESVYALSVENPALLYQFKNNKLAIV